MTFEELKLSEHLNESIKRLGFTKPTLIQKKSIPPIMEGRDVIGESATGSGKTLAFGCGLVEKVKAGAGLQSLILVPTRELAEQVNHELRKIAYIKKLKIVAVYGGVAINPQVDDLARAEVAVCTPGRLLDHMQRRSVKLSSINFLVLDEADRMFDMGFIDDVERIISVCPRERQTLFFSATISSRVKELARKHMKNPFLVSAEKMVDPSKLKQVYFDIQKSMKLSLLVHLLKNEKSDLVMVFCNTRRSTDFVVKNLKANQIDATAIHGGLSQNKRSKTLKNFNDAKTSVLVCTDVAARGLHIDDVTHVYNFEIPNDPKDYVHRIGRTARAGEEGKVINLICDMDYDNFSRLQRDYRDINIEKEIIPQFEKVQTIKPENRQHSRRPGFGGGHRGSHGRSGARPHHRHGERSSHSNRGPSHRERGNDGQREHSGQGHSQRRSHN